MKLDSAELLKLAERLENVRDILEKQGNVDELLDKFATVEAYLARFSSLEELTAHLKQMEDKIYAAKTYLTTNEAIKYLSMSKWSLLEAAKRRELPYYIPPGKSYYFAKEDLDIDSAIFARLPR